MSAAADTVDREVRPGLVDRLRLKELKRLGLYLAIGLAVLAIVGYGYHWVTVGRFIETTDDAYVGGDITVIAPKVAGFIEQVAVNDNQSVQPGDLLVKLDDKDYQAALARAQAAVDAQQATLANLDATRRLQSASYNAAVDLLGEVGVVELVGIIGYYAFIAMTLNVFDVETLTGERPLAGL